MLTLTRSGDGRPAVTAPAGADLVWSVRCRRRGTTTVVHVAGELDIVTAPDLERHLAHVRHWATTELVVACHDLSFADVHGLRVLIRAGDAAAARGVRFSITGLRPHVARAYAVASGVRHSPAAGGVRPAPRT